MKSVTQQLILIVEDEPKLNKLYKAVLEEAGYKAVATFNGQEALMAATKNTPALILLDIRMPHMDGLAFLREYDALGKHAQVKVIVFSNYATQAYIDEAYKLGAERYILKAWASPKELLRIVRDTLQGTGR